jgi:hypothetical protein
VPDNLASITITNSGLSYRADLLVCRSRGCPLLQPGTVSFPITSPANGRPAQDASTRAGFPGGLVFPYRGRRPSAPAAHVTRAGIGLEKRGDLVARDVDPPGDADMFNVAVVN